MSKVIPFLSSSIRFLLQDCESSVRMIINVCVEAISGIEVGHIDCVCVDEKSDDIDCMVCEL